jgi:hypothetical protein
MPKSEDQLGPDFENRLRAELNRIRPPGNLPRYAAARPAARVWPLAPAALVIALAGVAGLTVWAATGNANPSVWTNRVETIINPPTPTPALSPTPEPPRAAPPAPANSRTPHPSQRPQGSPTPEPQDSPEPGDDRSATSGSGAGPAPGASPTPSPDY